MLVSHSAPASILGDWQFDDGSGTTAMDSSGNNNHGTLVNFADTTAGAGNAGISGWTTDGRLAFDGVTTGTGDHIATTFNLALLQNKSFTLETIVSHDNPGQNWSPILGQAETNTSRIFYFGKQQNTGTIHYNIAGFGGGVNTGVSFADGGLHHLALVFDNDADTLKLFLDGQERYARTGVTGAIAAATNLMIGGIGHNAGERWNGFADRVRVSDEALPPDQFLVPEPGCAVLVACGALGMVLRRRRAGLEG